jgi:uncharacterized glyoxalase superfamily protein PhnB
MLPTLILLAAQTWAAPRFIPTPDSIIVKNATLLVTVDAIDPCLPFWTDLLGFELTATVPHEDAIGFAMLNKGGVELMYQSRASVAADLGASGAPTGLADEMASGTATLFIEVEDLDEVIASLGDDADVLVPRRQTFYGMDEIFVRAPCGTVVGFAARIADGEG